MSFVNDKDVIEDGDLVILHLGQQNMQKLTVSKGKTHQTRWGCLRHDDILDKPFGSRIECANGYIYALKPTPELWTVTLSHRTQILYSTDISVVILQLDLKPGKIVVESGTGSGSLSHAIIRTVIPDGHLYTYEFHEQRALVAKEEFTDHGFADNVTVTHRDVIERGFDLNDKADAVFLDLPNPQQAVAHARDALKPEGGRLCSFSPCIEQVQKTCVEMSKLDFQEITTMECLIRNFEVRSLKMATPDMGDIEPLSYADDNALGLLCQSEQAVTFKSAIPPQQQAGHTGYLTFATLFHKSTDTT
ncbi:tRNA (adenine(58)-N(1))-methyltransferase catalytic subunit TRMT61A-like [Watersipora subatra]|uniref:tRNA (adenine(58)-N(1))-methyltransferase catalytic subunit TRMT61A-like n=1 Tax=Watersipora subatra TaxID=2589382 RepID=UPI00355BF207